MTTIEEMRALVDRLDAKRMRVHDLGGVGYEPEPDSQEAAVAIRDLLDRLAAAEEELRVAREVIRPFAFLRCRYDFDRQDDENKIDVHLPGPAHKSSSIAWLYVGEIQKARQFLSRNKGGGE